jgi:hypothetical protein
MDVVAVDLANGQVKEAIALLEQVVATRKRVLAEDDPDRLTSQHELARAYRANGQVKEAIALSWEMGSTPARDLRAFVLVEVSDFVCAGSAPCPGLTASRPRKRLQPPTRF